MRKRILKKISNRVLEECFSWQEIESRELYSKAQTVYEQLIRKHFEVVGKIPSISRTRQVTMWFLFALWQLFLFPRGFTRYFQLFSLNYYLFCMMTGIYLFVLFLWFRFFFFKRMKCLKFILSIVNLRIRGNVKDEVAKDKLSEIKKIPLTSVLHRVLESCDEAEDATLKSLLGRAQQEYERYLSVHGLSEKEIPVLRKLRQTRLVFWSCMMAVVAYSAYSSIYYYHLPHSSAFMFYVFLALYIYHFFLFPKRQIARLLYIANRIVLRMRGIK